MGLDGSLFSRIEVPSNTDLVVFLVLDFVAMPYPINISRARDHTTTISSCSAGQSTQVH